jgi:hypothetical protein
MTQLTGYLAFVEERTKRGAIRNSTLADEAAGCCETRSSIYLLEGANGSDVMPDLGDGVLTVFY